MPNLMIHHCHIIISHKNFQPKNIQVGKRAEVAR